MHLPLAFPTYAGVLAQAAGRATHQLKHFERMVSLQCSLCFEWPATIDEQVPEDQARIDLATRTCHVDTM